MSKKSNNIDDYYIFEDYVKSIKKLKSNKITPTLSENKIKNIDSNTLSHINPPIKKSNSVDKNTLKKLASGDYKISARLDFHGCTIDEMTKKLESVIPDLYNVGKRCLLIITGKGNRTKDEYSLNDNFSLNGVLRSNLPRILQSSKIAPYVLTHCVAQQKDGGNGAFYILLRSNRELKSKD